MRKAPTTLLLMIGCVLGLAPAACDQCDCNTDGAKARADKAPTDARGEPDAKYTVRGRVKMIPESGKPQTEFAVHHEAIPDFKRTDGKLGMNEMIMPFPLAKGVDLAGIARGDIVEMELVVWSTPGKLDMETRRVTKLPAETKLTLKGE